MIYVCWAELSKLSAEGENLLLSDYRKERLASIKFAEERRRSLGAELLLIHALKICCPDVKLPPRILCSENGKPYLADGRWHFNVSHSGLFAACALSDHEIGLDIQKNVLCRDVLLRRVLTPEEQTYLEESGDRDAAFTELWCKKESFVKATGKGLSTGFQSFCVAPGKEKLLSGEKNFEIEHRRFSGFQLALCYPEPKETSIIFEERELP